MINTSTNICGLFELDTAGTVLYSKPEAGNQSDGASSDFIGLNFFEQVAPFRNVEEFRRRFRHFAHGSEAAERFTFTCQLEESPVEVNVMLARISEREFNGNNKLIIVDIRNNKF